MRRREPIQMVRDPTVVGTAVASVVGLIGLIRVRRRAASSIRHRKTLVHLAETYTKGLADVAFERERRATIVAVLAAVPAAAETVTDLHSDGAKLMIRFSPTISAPKSKGDHLPDRRGHVGL
jgi:hypothetical protein